MSEQGYLQDTPELYYTGTQMPSAVNYSSSTRFQQDVDNGLLDESSYDFAPDIELWDPTYSPLARPLMANELTSIDNIQTVQRTDSGLNARARPFVPASQQPYIPGSQLTDRVVNTTIPVRTQFMQQQLTPIRTNFEPYQTRPPYSTPAYPQDALPNDISPLVTVTNDLYSTYMPFDNGYQWPLKAAPAQRIDTWVDTITRNGQLIPNYIDPTLLTPTTPGSQQGSSSLGCRSSRSPSIASATTYHCEHTGCKKDFKTKQDYAHHRRNHGPRNHICSQCPMRFVFKKDLKRHIKIHYPAQREFFCTFTGCPFAERGFQRKDHYDRHMKKTHAHQTTGMITPITSSAPMSRSASGV